MVPGYFYACRISKVTATVDGLGGCGIDCGSRTADIVIIMKNRAPGFSAAGVLLPVFRDGADFAPARDKMGGAAVSSTNVLNDPEPI